MQRLEITVTVPRTTAAARGAENYGECVLQPTAQELSLLGADERVDLFTRSIPCNGWQVTEPTWTALLATYRELRAKEAAAKLERQMLEERYTAAADEVTWDSAQLRVVAPDLPYLPECRARDAFACALRSVRHAGLTAADAAVATVERAKLIIAAAGQNTYQYGRVPTPRSDALVAAQRQAVEAEELEALAQQRAEQRELLAQWGSSEQLERFDARVLPERELRDVIDAHVWPKLPRYIGLKREDVTSQCADGEACEVEFFTRELDDDDATYSAEQWAALKAIRSALADRDANIVVVRHSARCRESHHEISRLAAHVGLDIAGLEVSRKFALGRS